MGGSFRRRQRSLLRRKPASRVPRRSLKLDCSPTSKKRVESNHGFVLFGRGSPGSGGFAEITIGDCVATDGYEIRVCSPSRFSLRDLGRCIRIVSAGDAVDPESATVEMPRAQVLAVASAGDLIVGVGAVKHRRPEYASHIAARSAVSFDPNASELGYIAIDAKHRGRRLSGHIVRELLASHQSMLFATTSSEHMKKILARTGFVQKGCLWEGRRGQQLSLWIKER